jgi:3-hydroxyisobutyrate dehydrogenase-like beta-hydroxyacid dehydrogenase
MKVGIIGLGRMGAGIASNIVRAGHDVIVWNRFDRRQIDQLTVETAVLPRLPGEPLADRKPHLSEPGAADYDVEFVGH